MSLESEQVEQVWSCKPHEPWCGSIIQAGIMSVIRDLIACSPDLRRLEKRMCYVAVHCADDSLEDISPSLV